MLNTISKPCQQYWSKWDFTLQLCKGLNATRNGILAKYDELIQNTAFNDATVIYYSGHGGLAVNPKYQPMEDLGVLSPRYHQFIVPVDMEETNDEDFRGITSLELSKLLAELTSRSKNVTIIMDCCHSARMSRDLELRTQGSASTLVRRYCLTFGEVDNSGGRFRFAVPGKQPPWQSVWLPQDLCSLLTNILMRTDNGADFLPSRSLWRYKKSEICQFHGK